MVTYQHLEVLLLLDERPSAVALARVNVGVLVPGAHHVVSDLLRAVLALMSALVLEDDKRVYFQKSVDQYLFTYL